MVCLMIMIDDYASIDRPFASGVSDQPDPAYPTWHQLRQAPASSLSSYATCPSSADREIVPVYQPESVRWSLKGLKVKKIIIRIIKYIYR